jgi:DNA-binding transcriptional MerR regulator
VLRSLAASSSELAVRAGVPVSTVRYYERIGLLPTPERTDSGYRDYDEDSATRLLFVSRARGLGIGCDQIAELLPAWHGSDCVSARDRIVSFIHEKQAEIAARVEELSAFAAQLQHVRESFDAVPAPVSPAACRPAKTPSSPWSSSNDLVASPKTGNAVDEGGSAPTPAPRAASVSSAGSREGTRHHVSKTTPARLGSATG